MAIRYYKLFDMLARKGYSKTDFMELVELSSVTSAKLSKGKSVSTSIIDRICQALDCQPADIMEYVKEV